MKKCAAEAIATFILIFCGTGAGIVNELEQGVISHAGVAIVWGLVVMVLIHAVGEISGSHMNPAVTIAFAVKGSFPKRQVLPYIISQVSGALVASFTLKFLFPDSVYLGATIPANLLMQSFILEVLLTFILMFVVLQVATGSKEQGLFAGITIGSVVLIEAMFAGPVSGASMNPARSIAPAIASGHLTHLWIYITAPVLGALIAVSVYNYFKS
jgi:aquaporin NIP